MLAGASIERRGELVELHFRLRGSTQWRLGGHGNQLWIDLDDTRLEIPPRPLFGRETAPLGVVRVTDAGSGRARIAIEVSEKSDYAVGRTPYELLIRLAPAGKVPDIAAPIPIRFAPSRSRNDGESSAEPIRRRTSGIPKATNGNPPIDSAITPNDAARKARVVIDAGHGGSDPGTQSAAGLSEKDCALQIARRLADTLRARGVNAALTRDGDSFLSLAERTRLANRAGADLFISIHLNWSPNLAASGIEVYYLNNTTDRATIRLARMENLSGTGDGAAPKSGLNYILSDLTQNYKADESASLARTIGAQTAVDLRAAFGTTVQDLGAKRGPFYVLVGAHMPAVLIECGFLSNPQEARRLSSPRYQARLATAIATAVMRYLNGDAAGGNL